MTKTVPMYTTGTMGEITRRMTRYTPAEQQGKYAGFPRQPPRIPTKSCKGEKADGSPPWDISASGGGRGNRVGPLPLHRRHPVVHLPGKAAHQDDPAEQGRIDEILAQPAEHLLGDHNGHHAAESRLPERDGGGQVIGQQQAGDDAGKVPPTVWGRFITARDSTSAAMAEATQISSTSSARQPKSHTEAIPAGASAMRTSSMMVRVFIPQCRWGEEGYDQGIVQRVHLIFHG